VFFFGFFFFVVFPVGLPLSRPQQRPLLLFWSFSLGHLRHPRVGQGLLFFLSLSWPLMAFDFLFRPHRKRLLPTVCFSSLLRPLFLPLSPTEDSAFLSRRSRYGESCPETLRWRSDSFSARTLRWHNRFPFLDLLPLVALSTSSGL